MAAREKSVASATVAAMALAGSAGVASTTAGLPTQMANVASVGLAKLKTLENTVLSNALDRVTDVPTVVAAHFNS